jgi:hypothetical protein
MSRKRRQPEAAIQRAVIEHLRWRHFPGCFWFHCPNGGAGRPIEAAILKALGVVAGIPDLIFIRDGHVYALELKAPGREPTPAQITTMNAMRAAGATVAVAHGVDEAIAQLEAWGLLRPNKNNPERARAASTRNPAFNPAAKETSHE